MTVESNNYYVIEKNAMLISTNEKQTPLPIIEPCAQRFSCSLSKLIAGIRNCS